MPIESWLVSHVLNGSQVYIAEAADYEVRRELKRLIKTGRIPANRMNRLDFLPRLFSYLPVSTFAWNQAADFWTSARVRGTPTAHQASLDVDVLIAAQAHEVNATVVTTNAKHMSLWVPVLTWP
jgi:predicted nucleic acid-binding protein